MGMHNGLIGQANGGASCNQSGTPLETNDLTLGDYYARKHREEAFNAVAAEKSQQLQARKLTFDEWFQKHLGVPWEDWDNNLNEDDMRQAWEAGQDNK